MALEAAEEGVATSFKFADNLVFTPAVGGCFVRLTSVLKEKSVSGRICEAGVVA